MNGATRARRLVVNVAALVVQVLLEALVAVLVVVAVGLVWTTLTEATLTATLPRMLFIAAAVWLFGAGSLFTRITTLNYLKWGVSGGSDDLGTQRRGDPGELPVELSPMGSSIFVAILLAGLATLLS